MNEAKCSAVWQGNQPASCVLPDGHDGLHVDTSGSFRWQNASPLTGGARNGERILGTVTTLHLSGSKYGGSYGEIQSDDGKDYVWSAGQWYRDSSRIEAGARVRFTVVAFCYASEITRRGVEQVAGAPQTQSRSQHRRLEQQGAPDPERRRK